MTNKIRSFLTELQAEILEYKKENRLKLEAIIKEEKQTYKSIK